jgi:hypothetical protein
MFDLKEHAQGKPAGAMCTTYTLHPRRGQDTHISAGRSHFWDTRRWSLATVSSPGPPPGRGRIAIPGRYKVMPDAQ